MPAATLADGGQRAGCAKGGPHPKRSEQAQAAITCWPIVRLGLGHRPHWPFSLRRLEVGGCVLPQDMLHNSEGDVTAEQLAAAAQQKQALANLWASAMVAKERPRETVALGQKARQTRCVSIAGGVALGPTSTRRGCSVGAQLQPQRYRSQLRKRRWKQSCNGSLRKLGG